MQQQPSIFSTFQKEKTEAYTYQATSGYGLGPALPILPDLILPDFVILELRVRPRTGTELKPR
jgi:hypothetical protein